MPNTPKTHSGKSLRSRARTGARLTRQDEQERREERSQAARARHPDRAGSQAPGRPSSHAKADVGTSSREGSRSRRRSSGRSKPSENTVSERGKGHASAKPRKGQASQKAKTASSTAKQAGGKLLGVLSSMKKRRLVGCIVAVALVLTVVTLYPVGQTYYQSLRDQQRLEAQVSAIKERNATVQKQNEDLKTDEGIEDAAREQGYVNEGDSAAIITNAGKSSSETKLPSQVDVDSIEAPHTWYYDILDVIFFVDQGD